MYAASVSGINDWEIISGIRSTGNSQNFGLLYKKYRQQVYKTCLGIVKNESLAKDMADEVFSVAYEKLDSFRHSSQFSTWLYAISKNHCLQFLRKQLRAGLFIKLDGSFDKEEDCYDNEQEQLLARLFTAYEQLSASDKEIFNLRFLQNKSIKEIACCTLKGESAVKMQIKRIKEKICIQIEHLTY